MTSDFHPGNKFASIHQKKEQELRSLNFQLAYTSPAVIESDPMTHRLMTILSPEFQDFLHANQHVEVTRLLLSPAPVDVKEAAEQITSKRKAKDKLSAWFAAESVVFPPPLSVEQSSSQQAADYKSGLISGDVLVDLTGGMGVDCLALSRRFRKTIYVEQDQWLCTLFRHNQQQLNDNPIQVENATAEDFLHSFRGRATLYIDPARRNAHQQKVFRFEDCSPDLTQLLGLLRSRADQVLVKAAPLIDLTLGIHQLQYVKEVHVVSIRNEVKEVLFLLDFAFQDEPEIHCVNLGNEPTVFRFKQQDEKKISPHHGPLKKYLYEPYSAILKAGAFKSISLVYPVQKLNANTHLYTSESYLADFPGRRWEVIASGIKKNVLKNLLPSGKANVITKNYPLKPEELKKKLKLKDGGENYIVGFRDEQDKPQLVLASSIKQKKGSE